MGRGAEAFGQDAPGSPLAAIRAICIINVNPEDQTYDRTGAYDDYTTAIKLDTKIPDAYYNRGVILSLRQQYHEAIADYNAAIALDESSSKYYNSRGNAYAGVNNIEQAKKDYHYSIELDESNPNPYYNLGLLYKNQLNLFQDAVFYFTKAHELGNDSILLFLNRGECYKNLEKYDLALDDYEKVLAVNPDDFLARQGRAQIKLKLGDYRGAGLDYLEN
jgi:Flp pilus assembly protein TadD